MKNLNKVFATIFLSALFLSGCQQPQPMGNAHWIDSFAAPGSDTQRPNLSPYPYTHPVSESKRGVKRPSNPSILNCEQALDAVILLTKETSDAFNGIEQFNTFEKAKAFCGKFNKINDCSNIANYSDCAVQNYIAGTASDSIQNCKNNEQCLIGYSASHLEDCDSLEKQSIGTTRINGTALKNICLYSQAFIKKDIAPCEKIQQINIMGVNSEDFSYQWNQSKCLWGVSDQTNNVSICENIEESIEKNICFFSYALKSNDKSFCHKITDSSQNATEEIIKDFGQMFLHSAELEDQCLHYDNLSADLKAKGILNIPPLTLDSTTPEPQTKNLAIENCSSFPSAIGVPQTAENYYVCFDDGEKICSLDRTKHLTNSEYDTEDDKFNLEGKRISRQRNSGSSPINHGLCSPTTKEYFNSIVKETSLGNSAGIDQKVLSDLQNYSSEKDIWAQYYPTFAQDEKLASEYAVKLDTFGISTPADLERPWYAPYEEILNYVGFDYKKIDEKVGDTTAFYLYTATAINHDDLKDKGFKDARRYEDLFCYPFVKEDGQWKMKIARFIPKGSYDKMTLDDPAIMKSCTDFIKKQKTVGSDEVAKKLDLEYASNASFDIYLNDHLLHAYNIDSTRPFKSGISPDFFLKNGQNELTVKTGLFDKGKINQAKTTITLNDLKTIEDNNGIDVANLKLEDGYKISGRLKVGETVTTVYLSKKIGEITLGANEEKKIDFVFNKDTGTLSSN